MTQSDFMVVMDAFKNKLFRLAKRLLISTEEAEDAVQEVFIKLWKQKEKLAHYDSIEAVAMTMTKNYCLDQLKSKRANNLRIVHHNFKNRDAAVDQKVEDSDSWSWVEKAINQLPDQQKLIVQMRDVEQFEFAEIATILDMNEIAIRVALSRARKSIREFMIKTHNYGIGENRSINRKIF